MRKTVEKKLIDAWRRGYTDQLAAMEVGIGLDDLKLMLKNDPALREDRMVAQAYINMKSRDIVADEIERGNVKAAEWYLERKSPDEFSGKSNVKLEGEVISVPLGEKEEELKKIMESYGKSERRTEESAGTEDEES